MNKRGRNERIFPGLSGRILPINTIKRGGSNCVYYIAQTDRQLGNKTHYMEMKGDGGRGERNDPLV